MRDEPSGLLMKVAMRGVPKLEHGPSEDAIFDPVVVDDVEIYLHYSGSIECWSMTRTLDEGLRKHVLPGSEETAHWEEKDIASINAIAFVKPPILPKELEFPMFQSPFWYKNRRFAWYLTDLQRGWQIVIVEDDQEAESSDVIEAAY